MANEAKKSMRVAVIGGAGFIGSHLVDALVAQGFPTRVIDNLDPQVHPGGVPPAYLNPRAEFVREDVRNLDGLSRAIEGVETVFYLAGAVGVGDSMYKIRHYAETNVVGGANLLEILANRKHSVRKIVLASSVTVYGEGKYSCPQHGIVFPSARSTEQTTMRQWELRCPVEPNLVYCSAQLTPLPIDEGKPLSPLSLYGVTKRTQEELFLTIGRAYGIPVCVLRYFNVYGSRQAASNPYTGVAKIFASDLQLGRAPLIYEDGLQTRDFVHVGDVVQATLLALSLDEANGETFNVGSGHPTTILETACNLATLLNAKVSLAPSHRFRAGDVRHCWADIAKIQKRLGFQPRMRFPAGIEEVLATVKSSQNPGETVIAHDKLVERGLIS
jgi:dTDP-L-rhamnose 4-epimerase